MPMLVSTLPFLLLTAPQKISKKKNISYYYVVYFSSPFLFVTPTPPPKRTEAAWFFFFWGEGGREGQWTARSIELQKTTIAEELTSEISVLMFSIILIWSKGIYADETSRFDWLLSGSMGKLGLSLPTSEAAFISWLEVLGLASAICIKIRSHDFKSKKTNFKEQITNKSSVSHSCYHSLCFIWNLSFNSKNNNNVYYGQYLDRLKVTHKFRISQGCNSFTWFGNIHFTELWMWSKNRGGYERE